MHKRGLGVVALVLALLISGSAGASASSSRSNNGGSDFWTHARVAKAKPRDFVFDPATRSYQPAAGKPGGSGNVTDASWTKNGAVKITTGKVLFELGGGYYVCSGSIVEDTSTTSSVILTAAHCVAENDGRTISRNWTFIPDYDSAPAPLSTSNTSYCASTKYGCWTASQIMVDTHFLNAGGFNDTAVLYDFAFVKVGAGGKANSQLDAIAGAGGGQAISFAAEGTDDPDSLVGDKAYAFGYPASGKYKGNDLVYSAGTVGTDPYNSNDTYAIGSNMTGGSSGGPWLGAFTESTGVGTLMSVNSYGYSGITKMHGPVLNSAAQSLYTSVD